MQRRIAIIVLSVSLAGGLTVPAVNAQVTSPRLDGALDFTSGGYVPRTPTRRTGFLTGGVGVKWKNNLMCGDLNPRVTISNQLNGLSEGFQQIFGQILQNAQAAVASLPALILQRANPGLYDLISQGSLMAKADFDAGKLSCEAIVEEIENRLPWGPMATQSKAGGWEEATENTSIAGDAVQAKKVAEAADGSVTWVCDREVGGVGQPPMKTTADVVQVGYNTLLQRYGVNQCSNNPVDAYEASSPMAQYWRRPIEAMYWAQDVLGDTYLAACDSCNKPFTLPAQGLVYQLKITTEAINTKLSALVTGTTSPITYDRLVDVSAPPGVMVTGVLIRQLQRMSPVKQDAIIDRLAGELAYARLMEQTRIMIQILRAGKKDDAVQANTHVIPYVDANIDALASELKLLNDEMVARKTHARETIAMLLGTQEQVIQETALPSAVKPATINTLGGGEEL